MHSTSNSNGSSRLGIAAVLFGLSVALMVFVGVASASSFGAPSFAPLPQATTPPQAVQTVQVPDAVATTANGQPAPVPTGDVGTGSTSDAGSPGNVTPGTATPASTSGGFPWLVLLLVLVALVVIALAFVMMRNRRTAVATTPLIVPPAPSTGSTVTPTSATSATTTTTTAAPAATTTATTAAVTSAAPAAAALPKTITCPNCSTVNDWSENFCHECGQDLRPARAAIVAASAPPPDIVTDDMPYLETLDRTDEQLEYVLSRKRILIGTAAGNDIVIDSSFKGAETVSPRHAELRREAEGNGFLLVDLNSDNGTFVNDARTGENLLAEGDQIRFGDVRFIYRVP